MVVYTYYTDYLSSIPGGALNMVVEEWPVIQ